MARRSIPIGLGMEAAKVIALIGLGTSVLAR
jgi:hypothetical protein